MIELEIKYEKLSKSDARKLHSIMRARHGNVKKVAERCGVSINTLKRAVGLLEITWENAECIKAFLVAGLNNNQS
jgi:transcriptional regulator with PAS, ATPase and Fis domain